MPSDHRLPSIGNYDWFEKYLVAFVAQITHHMPADEREKILEHARAIQSTLGPLSQLRAMGRCEPVPEQRLLPSDQTAHLKFEGNWQTLAADFFADTFGRFGLDTVSTISEATFHAYALGSAFGAESIFYRGEHHFGHPLKSRAERHIPDGTGQEPGLTQDELRELRRFQSDVRKDKVLARELRARAWCLPRRNDPIWLPIMQHYDEQFGTRLLDITSSIYSGLYFACVDWGGDTDESLDGVLYAFFSGSGTGAMIRGSYFDRKTDEYDSDWDDLAPQSVVDSFRDWQAPEYFRLYKSSSANPREVAQDGWFLVRGALKGSPKFGQGFKFRVPGTAKPNLAIQLWMAGYTPERMVRGSKGRIAHQVLKKNLGL